MIGVAMGINNLLEIFNEKYYENLEGGILESMGRMFRHAVKLYVYPMRQDAYDRYLSSGHPASVRPANTAPANTHASASEIMITAQNLQLGGRLRNLYAYLLENDNLDSIRGCNPDYLNIFSRDVLQRIKSGDASWEKMVPTKVAEFIKERKLLGYGAKAQAAG